MFAKINRIMSESEIRAEIESYGLTVMAVFRNKGGGLLGISSEKSRKGVHAFPRCSICTDPKSGITEIEVVKERLKAGSARPV